ncbi:histidine phosphatase family protein [Streptomyces fungicidicus]|uniref:histidine phosphatase family protein n=1 Tax=Streptomyces fungicidicus TaxID=68203 RepID=UPI0036D10790
MREFIVEADGGSRGNPGPAGYGAVVSDAATGETLAEAAEYIGVATNNVAEYRGLVAGLRAAHELDPDAAVHVRMDSKLVVEQMTGRWKIKHPAMKPLAAEAARVFPPERVTYEWIPRERNKHADRLANEAMDAGRRGEQWSESASRAALDTPRPEPAGPPADAAAGAARVRAALASTSTPTPGSPRPSTGAPAAGPADATPTSGAEPATAPDSPRPADDTTGVPAPGADAAGAEADAGAARIPGGGTAAESAASGSGRAGGEAAGASRAEALAAGAGPAEADAGAARVSGETAAEPGDATGDPAAGADAAAADAGPARVSGGTAAASGSARAGGEAAGASAAGAPGAGAAGAGAASTSAEVPGAEVGRASTRASGAGGEGDDRAARSVTAAAADADVRAARTVATPGVGWAPPDMGAPATFVLLRHGETPLTPQKRFSGSGGSDPSLSDIGREQAARVAEFLARRGTVQAVVSSPLARTRETARIVAARLGLEVAVEDGLRETDFGAWEGLTFGEVRERHPDDLNAWLSSPDAEPTGGGESFAATADRIAATRDKLTAAYAGRTVLLVTHVTPIKTFVRLALGAPPEALFRMELSAASLSAVAYYADGNASVRLFNETSHLR